MRLFPFAFALFGLACALNIFGCQSEILRSPTLFELQNGNICIYHAQDRETWDEYTVFYVVDAPLEAAWESSLGNPDWLMHTPLSKELKELPPDDTDPPSTARFIVTWLDGSKQEAVLRRDGSKQQLDISLTSGDSAPGSPGHCSITMEPFRRSSTLVQAVIRIRNTFARRLADLIVAPVGAAKLAVREAALQEAWEAFATAHRKASVALFSRKAPSSGRTHIVAIGAGCSTPCDYWPALKYADSDAEAFFDWAQRAYPVADANSSIVRALVTGKKAQSSEIGALVTRLSKVAEGDTIIFFFAGHMDRETDALSPHQPLQTYLVVANSDFENLRFTGIRKDDVLNAMRSSRASQCLLICDACFSGGKRVSSPSRLQVLRTRGRVPVNVIPSAADEKLVILAAAEALGQAAESDDVRHGLFTFALLEGLSGKADKDGDAYVTLDELSRYLSEQVPAQTQRRQMPYASYPSTLGSSWRWHVSDKP